jgi:uncharacterized protein YecE (DUF72 family)
MAQLFAGTSGFAYSSWKPLFYPPRTPAKDFLKFYAQKLNTVEINYTFRRIPSAATLQAWAEATPAGFLFALKAPMRITHILKLADAAQATEVFLNAVDRLRPAGRLGPILFQLPPQMACDLDRLAGFLPELPPQFRYAFEFRNKSWFTGEVYRMLEARNVSLCVAESEKLEVPEVITADFVYFRLRKPDYGEDEVREIGERARGLVARGRDVFLIFKHEETPEGALNAARVLNAAGQAL